jgi:branched-chain amino acid transport system substrate-binding protein
MKLKMMVALSALTLGTVAQAQTTQGVSKTEVLIGSIQDLSGPLAGFGKQLRMGMQLRVDEVNEQGRRQRPQAQPQV